MEEKSNVRDYCFDDGLSEEKLITHRQRMKHDKRFMCMSESWAIRVFEIARRKQSPGPVIVGLILWQKFWMERAKQPLKVTNPMLDRFGIKRPFFAKWLGPLEKAGLIQVERFKHRSPLITIMVSGD